MSTFHPSNLTVTLHPPATFFQPIDNRKYTLTHSDDTGELFLDIGYMFNEGAINVTMRDEVLAEWQRDTLGNFQLLGKAHVDAGEYEKQVAEYRFTIFQKEMETAIKGIIFGDRPFYTNFPSMLNAPIFIHYQSVFPEYNKMLYYGTPGQYLRIIDQVAE